MTYEVTVVGTAEAPVVQIAGDIDLSATQALTSAAYQAAVGQRVVFDMSRMDFMDSSGLRVLVKLAREGVTPVLRGASAHLRELLETTQLSPLMELEDDA